METRILGYLSWQGLSVLVQAVAQLGITAVLARFLVPHDFGLVAAANIAITFVQMVAEGGIGSAVVQRDEITPNFVGVALAISMVISGACYLLLVVIAVPFESIFQMQSLHKVIFVLGLSSLLAGPSGVLEGLLQRNLRFAALFKVNLFSSVLGYAVPALFFAIAGAGVWALVLGTLGRIGTKVLFMALVQRDVFQLAWDRAAVRHLLHFGFGLTQDRFWNWLSGQAAPFFIGVLFGQALLGQFYMGSQLAILPAQYVSTIVSAVFFPLMSRSLASPERAAHQFLTVMSATFVFLTAMGLFLALNAEVIVPIAFGPGWQEAVSVFEFLSFGAGIRACIQICDSLNVARGDVYALANRRAVTAAVLLGSLFAARRLGLTGAAVAIMASHIAMLAMTITLAVRGLGITSKSVRPFVRLVAISGALFLSMDIFLIYLRESGRIGGVPLLGWGIIANMVIAIPSAVRFSSTLGANPTSVDGGKAPSEGG